jgi:hypothetical protein
VLGSEEPTEIRVSLFAFLAENCSIVILTCGL